MRVLQPLAPLGNVRQRSQWREQDLGVLGTHFLLTERNKILRVLPAPPFQPWQRQEQGPGVLVLITHSSHFSPPFPKSLAGRRQCWLGS